MFEKEIEENNKRIAELRDKVSRVVDMNGNINRSNYNMRQHWIDEIGELINKNKEYDLANRKQHMKLEQCTSDKTVAQSKYEEQMMDGTIIDNFSRLRRIH